MKTSLHRSLAVTSLLALAAVGTAYTVNGNNAGGGFPRWAGDTLSYRFNTAVSDTLPTVEDGSNPRQAFRDAMAQWQQAVQFTFSEAGETAIQNTQFDQINLITFANTPANNAALAGATSQTIVTFNSSNQIFDGDIVVSSQVNLSTLGTQGHRSIRAIANSRVGALLAVSNSALWSANAWPFDTVTGLPNNLEAYKEALTQDDIAGGNANYPRASFTTTHGTITGIVRRSNVAVYGAHVVAVNQATGIAHVSNVTVGSNQGSNAGRYRIGGLPSGVYYLLVEPLDLPATSANFPGDYSLGDFWGGTFNTNFQTTFRRVNNAVFLSTVTAGTSTTADITVGTAAATMNPTGVTLSPNGQAYSEPFRVPVVVGLNSRRTLIIQGPGLNKVTASGVAISDPLITTDPGSFRQGTASNGEPYLMISFRTPAAAPDGPRVIFLTAANGELVILPGGLIVKGTVPPREDPANPLQNLPSAMMLY